MPARWQLRINSRKYLISSWVLRLMNVTFVIFYSNFLRAAPWHYNLFLWFWRLITCVHVLAANGHKWLSSNAHPDNILRKVGLVVDSEEVTPSFCRALPKSFSANRNASSLMAVIEGNINENCRAMPQYCEIFILHLCCERLFDRAIVTTPRLMIVKMLVML